MPLVDVFSRSYWGFGGWFKEPFLVMVIHKYIGEFPIKYREYQPFSGKWFVIKDKFSVQRTKALSKHECTSAFK